MPNKYSIFILFIFLPAMIHAQIYLADNGLTVSGTGTSKKVQLGGTLTLATDIDLGATFTYSLKKSTTSYFFVKNDGSIGVGTNAPSAKLDVNGLTRLRAALTMNYGTANRTVQLTDAGLYISRTSDGSYPNNITANTEMLFNTPGNYRFLNNASEKFTILQAGNVGIGYSTPRTNLDVNGYINANSGISISANAFTGTQPLNGGQLYFQSNALNYSALSGPGFSHKFFTSNVERFQINDVSTLFSNTNVGIGTLTPTAKFHTNGSLRFEGLPKDSTAARLLSTDINGNLSWRDAATFGAAAGSWTISGVNIVNPNTGNVGIGTASPTFKLDVTGTARITGALTANANNNQIGNFQILTSGNAGGTGAGVSVTGVDAVVDYQYGALGMQFRSWVGTTSGMALTTIDRYNIRNYGGFQGAVNVDNISGVALGITPTYNVDGSGRTNITVRGIYYNPTITTLTNITHYAFEASSGKIKVADLSGTGTRMVVADASGILSTQAISSGSGNWNTSGNNIVNVNTGFVGIGTSVNPAPADLQLKLAVSGNIYAQKLKITQTGWADYVFEPHYQLMTLTDLESFILQHKHLPDVPTASEVESKGLDLGDNQAVLLKKIEELTLYVIELKKEIDKMKEEGQTNNHKK